MDDITAINVLNMIQAHGSIAIDAKNTAIEALMSKIEMENFIIQLSKIIYSNEYPEYKEDDIFSLCSNGKLYPRVYKLIHDGKEK